MGLKSSTDAVKLLVTTNHSTSFDVIGKTLRSPFDAINAGELTRNCSACLIAPRSDLNEVFSTVRGTRLQSTYGVSVFVVVDLEGRTSQAKYEAKIDQLLDLCDALATTFDAATPDASANFSKLQIGALSDIYDENEAFIGMEIPLQLTIDR